MGPERGRPEDAKDLFQLRPWESLDLGRDRVLFLVLGREPRHRPRGVDHEALDESFEVVGH